jgi:hypothetical protein
MPELTPEPDSTGGENKNKKKLEFDPSTFNLSNFVHVH